MDEQAGEVPVAFVVKSNGSTVSEDEIKQFVSKQVSQFLTIELESGWILYCTTR